MLALAAGAFSSAMQGRGSTRSFDIETLQLFFADAIRVTMIVLPTTVTATANPSFSFQINPIQPFHTLPRTAPFHNPFRTAQDKSQRQRTGVSLETSPCFEFL